MRTGHLRTGALSLVTLSCALGFARVFDDARFAVPLVAVVLIAHAMAAATRRLALGVPTLAMAASGLVSVIVFTNASATTWGIPTLSTFSTIADEMRSALEVFQHGSAPTAPSAGLLLIAAASLWVAAWSADRLNFSYRTPLEAIAPAATVFGVVTLLAGPHHRWVSAGIFGLSIAVHLLVERTVARHVAVARSSDDSAKPLWRPIAGGGVMATIAVLAGLGVAAGVPALRSDGAIPIRSNLRDGPPRSVVSPLVDIRSRLLDQSDAEMFRVRSTQSAYWRLMTLDSFDGTVWSSDQRFRSTEGELPPAPATDAVDGSAPPMVAAYAMTGLGGPWAPAAFRPVALEGSDALLWDAEGSTLIVRSSVGEVTGLDYQVTSVVPQITGAEAENATGPPPEAVRRANLALPDHFPSDLGKLARRITDEAKTPYGKALALQSYFRDNPHFRYSTKVAAGEDINAIRSFLRSGVGFCEQFAGAYAALARAAGLPSRIAVGFTSGERQGDEYVVYGRNAHAWPEVYLSGIGWLAFEPTPGRGNPAAESYTGIPPQQAGPRGTIEATPTTLDPAPVPTGPATTLGEPATAPPPTIAPAPIVPAAHDSGGSRPLWPLLVAIGLALIVCAGPVTRHLRHRRRHRLALTPAQQISLAWHEALDAWRPLRLDVRRSETNRDLGKRLAERIRNLPDAAPSAGEARRLAELSTVAAWHAAGVDADQAEEARSCALELTLIARRHRSRWSLFLSWFDPRVPLRPK